MREWLSGRASPCQGERREFESRLPLQKYKRRVKSVFCHKWCHSQVVRPRSATPLFPSSNLGGASKKRLFERIVFFQRNKSLRICEIPFGREILLRNVKYALRRGIYFISQKTKFSISQFTK